MPLSLHVMADEQSGVLAALETHVRFARISTGDQRRLADEVRRGVRELTSIEAGIEDLDRDEEPSSTASRVRRDELKDRLRRLAMRLALLENAVGAR